MGAKGERLGFPVCQPEQRANADPPESAGIRALRTIQPPVEILLRSGGVELLVSAGIVGFLINNEALGAVADDFRVLIIFHRPDFQAERRDERLQRVEAVLQVAVGDKLRVLAGDQQDIPEAEAVEVTRFSDDLVHGEGRPENGGIARETAVFAVVHALVGDVERREEAHRFPEMAARHLLALPRERFERSARFLGNKLEEPPHQRSRAFQKSGKNIRKSHRARNVRRAMANVKGGFPRILPAGISSSEIAV